MYSDNNYINKKDDHQERLKKIFYYLKENISSQDIKIHKAFLFFSVNFTNISKKMLIIYLFLLTLLPRKKSSIRLHLYSLMKLSLK